MKTILCFGDSNTFGEVAGTLGRFEYRERWTGVMAAMLGGGYHVIEEGLNGRTTVHEDPYSEGLCGLAAVTPLMMSHRPLDAMIVMLGTNDTKQRFCYHAQLIAKGMARLLTKAEQTPAWKDKPNIILVAPAPILPVYAERRLATEFGPGADEKSREIAAFYRQLAAERGILFCDAGTVAAPSPDDGIHLNAESHAALAGALVKIIKNNT
jgi:lysophospholipase L1-like esterase